MLTLDSKFSEYVKALRDGGACEEVVAIHEDMLKQHPDYTILDLGKQFTADPNFDDGWAFWVIKLMGQEMAEDFREYTIGLIKSPMRCLQLEVACPFLTDKEKRLLKSKYDGKGKDIDKALTCLEAIKKSREFNRTRIETIANHKAVKEDLEPERTKVNEATKQVVLEQGFDSVSAFEEWFKCQS